VSADRRRHDPIWSHLSALATIRVVPRETDRCGATTDTRDEAALLQVSQDIGTILVQGIRVASVVPTFFSQVAASMLAVAAARFSAQGYEAPLRSGFVRHGILPPSMAVAATHAHDILADAYRDRARP
jgi:hypothetical protein